MKFVLALAMLVAFTASASAQSFYIVQDAATKKCTVVTEKPTVTSMVVIGDTVYKTKTEAEAGLKTTTVCTQ
ncbi:MAG: hypothetical protein JNL04_17715 [Rhodospirillaceae bacterium]|nr:hypothetical protein [Rhodospirillaceae bacterium]